MAKLIDFPSILEKSIYIGLVKSETLDRVAIDRSHNYICSVVDVNMRPQEQVETYCRAGRSNKERLVASSSCPCV